MQKFFEKITNDFQSFIEQRDDVVLVVQCKEIETAYILKILQSIDEGTSPDTFWTFVDDFNDVYTYVREVIERFKEKHDIVCESLKEEGEAPWPPIPAFVFDESNPPVERVRQLMIFARSLLWDPEGQLLVWVLCPLQVKDPEGYARMIGELVYHQFPFPWCHHMRIIVRDNVDDRLLSQHLENYERVRFYAPDLSSEAMEKSIEEEAADEELPLERRMQSLLMMAGMDYSNKRYEDALAKYELLLRYYAGTENQTMSALVLNGMGEVCGQQGNQKDAQFYYEAALTPAIENKAYPVLLNVTLNLANIKLDQKQWGEAASYYDSADKMATAFLNAPTKIGCLENLGYCKYMEGNIEGALECWESGATLARSVDENFLLKNLLERLKEHFGKYGPSEKLNDIERELLEIEKKLPDQSIA